MKVLYCTTCERVMDYSENRSTSNCPDCGTELEKITLSGAEKELRKVREKAMEDIKERKAKFIAKSSLARKRLSELKESVKRARAIARKKLKEAEPEWLKRIRRSRKKLSRNEEEKT